MKINTHIYPDFEEREGAKDCEHQSTVECHREGRYREIRIYKAARRLPLYPLGPPDQSSSCSSVHPKLPLPRMLSS